MLSNGGFPISSLRLFLRAAQEQLESLLPEYGSRFLKFALLIVCLVHVIGCASIKRPLCPTLALQSYAPPVPAEHSLNNYLAQEASKRGIKVSVLSPFEVELSGGAHQISWFKKNYPSLMCGFNPIGVPQREVEYTTCMLYIDSWTKIVNSKTPGDLMLDQSHYPGVCTQ